MTTSEPPTQGPETPDVLRAELAALTPEQLAMVLADLVAIHPGAVRAALDVERQTRP